MNQFIVAELSKTWIEGNSPDAELIATKFERCIEHNRERGYRLQSFSLHRMMVGISQMNETIIAVFEKEKREADKDF